MIDVAGKRLLVLGANSETASFIVRAQERGVYVIVADRDRDAYCKSIANEACDIDASDIDSLVAFARREFIDGVAVGVSEVLLPAYVDLCNRLHLPAYSDLETFQVLTHKDWFKDACRHYEVPVVDEYDPAHVPAEAYPVIVKPTDSSGSRGITICWKPGELDVALMIAKKASPSGTVIVERYMSGDEAVLYYYMQSGEASFAAMCDRYTYRASGRVQLPVCYVFPSRHLAANVGDSDERIKAFAKGVGMREGSTFLQAFIDEKTGRAVLYEPGYRLNGAQEYVLVSDLTGLDARDLYINYALTGQAFDGSIADIARPAFEGVSCMLSPIARTGKIARLEGIDQIAGLPGIIGIFPGYRDGDTISGDGTLAQVACRFYIKAPTYSELARRIEIIYSLFHVLDEDGQDMIVGRFDPYSVEELY